MTLSRHTVLGCIDGSRYSEAVAHYAAWVAKRVGAPLQFLHNIEHRETPVANLSGNIGLGSREDLLDELTELEARRSKLLMEQGKVMLDIATAEARVHGVEADTVQRHGSLLESLIEWEEQLRVVVIGIRGEQHQDQEDALGAQLESVIRALHRPVLVVNRPFKAPPQRVMLAYDGSEAANKALDMVCQSDLYHGMAVHLVHVSRDGDDTALLDGASGQLRDAGLEVTAASLTGNVDRSLIDYQQEHAIDLTVMGAFGHSRLRELLLGSVTNRILTRSQVPLLLLR